MRPEWLKLASLGQKICTLEFQFFGAFFASKGNPFKNTFKGLFLKCKHMFYLNIYENC